MSETRDRTLSKVPAVTLGFWIIKVLATTLGETGGDTVTMTLGWGYLAGTALFAALLVALGVAQILSRRFNPVLYWATIIASTTFGTTMADFADRSRGIGYTGGATLLLACLGLPWAARAAVVVLVVAPVSVALGLPFPLGLARAAEAGGGALPWAWAVNGAFSVVATPLANLLAIRLGFGAALLAAAGLYVVVLLVPPRIARSPQWQRTPQLN